MIVALDFSYLYIFLFIRRRTYFTVIEKEVVQQVEAEIKKREDVALPPPLSDGLPLLVSHNGRYGIIGKVHGRFVQERRCSVSLWTTQTQSYCLQATSVCPLSPVYD
jgi:hypothetical protein